MQVHDCFPLCVGDDVRMILCVSAVEFEFHQLTNPGFMLDVLHHQTTHQQRPKAWRFVTTQGLAKLCCCSQLDRHLTDAPFSGLVELVDGSQLAGLRRYAFSKEYLTMKETEVRDGPAR